MSKTLIIPGLYGSGVGHWQSYWLEDQRDALLVAQDDWSRPVREEWLYKLENELLAHPDAVLVAHSLGSILVACLAGRPSANHVRGALLVAPADVKSVAESYPYLASFSEMPQDPLPFPSILVASHNDPFMRFDRARYFADRWGSGLVDLGEAGHINPAGGFGRWEDGYALVSWLQAGPHKAGKRPGNEAA